MARSTKRASETQLNVLHRLTVTSINSEMRRLRRAKQPVPAALLTAAIKLLSVTGSTTPERPANRPDRLAGLLKEFDSAEERDNGRVPDFTPPPYPDSAG